MALSGSFGVGTNGNITGLLEWWVTTPQDIANNQSQVNFTLKFRRTNTTAGGSFGSVANWYVWVNGQQTSASHSYSYPSNMSWVQVHSGSVWVPHDSNGGKSVRIEVDGNTDTHDVNYTDTWQTLDTIARASTFNGSIDWTAGVDNFWMSIDRKDSSFHHTVQMFVRNTADTEWIYINQRTWVGDSGWWNFTEQETKDIYTTIGGFEERPVLIRVYTYNAGHTVVIGDYTDVTGKVRAYATGYPSFNDFNIGTTSVPATIVNYDYHFEYDVTMNFGSWSKSFGLVGQSFNMTFDQTDFDNMYRQIPNDNRGFGAVVVRTKYKGVSIEDGAPASNKRDFIAYVVNSNPIFDSSQIRYEDINPTTLALTGNSQYIIQNKSTFKVWVDSHATVLNFATISKYIVQINGAMQTSASTGYYTFGAINSATNLTLSVTIYDSRGNYKTVTKDVLMIPYSPPALNTSATRENGFGSNVTLTLAASISPVNVNGSNKNTLKPANVYYQWRQAGGGWSAMIQFLGQVLTMPNLVTNPVALTMDTTLAYEIYVIVKDELGYSEVYMNLPVGTPIVFIDDVKKSVGVGKFPTGNGTFETKGVILSESSVGATNTAGNSDASVSLGFNNNIARIRLAGNGVGVGNGFQIQGASDLVKFAVDNNGNATIPGTLYTKGVEVIGNAGRITPNDNLDTTWQIGNYSFSPSTVGRPVDGYGIVEVHVSDGTVYNNSGNWIWQIARTTESPSRVFQRNRVNAGSWSSWKTIAGGVIDTLVHVGLSLQNGWVPQYNTYEYPGYTKTAVGIVYLKGTIANGLYGVPLAVLPVGCRPADRRIFIVRNSGSLHARLDVENNGTISLQEGNGTWASLDGINFLAER